MKKLVISLFVILVGTSSFASTQTNVPAVESVKSFARPADARFQYSLPDKYKFKKNDSTKAPVAENESGEIVLEPSSSAKQQKKIIKKLSVDTVLDEMSENANNSNVPMNYDSFPKYYDPNSMMQNQFLMPMGGY